MKTRGLIGALMMIGGAITTIAGGPMVGGALTIVDEQLAHGAVAAAVVQTIGFIVLLVGAVVLSLTWVRPRLKEMI